MNALLLVLALTTSTLVLRSGDRIVVDEGTLREANGRYTFRSGGALYSLAVAEVSHFDEPRPAAPEKPVWKLRLSPEERERLLAELEKNHGGTPPPPPQEFIPETQPPYVAPLGEEAEWRARARDHEEQIRRTREDLLLIETRIQQLRDQIYSFISLGYRPIQFSYQTTELERMLEQVPYAKLEVTRAERAWAEFKEDARRAGVMPGWLR